MKDVCDRERDPVNSSSSNLGARFWKQKKAKSRKYSQCQKAARRMGDGTRRREKQEDQNKHEKGRTKKKKKKKKKEEEEEKEGGNPPKREGVYVYVCVCVCVIITDPLIFPPCIILVRIGFHLSTLSVHHQGRPHQYDDLGA